MVRDGILYASGLMGVAVLLGWAAGPAWAAVPLPFAAFFLWFFRDPDRVVPETVGAIVSPADGRVTDIGPCQFEGRPRTRISIFLSPFNVHVNRSPIAGVIRKSQYKKGVFRSAIHSDCVESNEQNSVVIEGEGQTVLLKQIAGVLARRIVFSKREGEQVSRGERVGMIKFGSRCDVIFSREAAVQVKVGDRVRAGSTVLALDKVAAFGQSSPAQVTEQQVVSQGSIRS